MTRPRLMANERAASFGALPEGKQTPERKALACSLGATEGSLRESVDVFE
jgi:hypothetical protein